MVVFFNWSFTQVKQSGTTLIVRGENSSSASHIHTYSCPLEAIMRQFINRTQPLLLDILLSTTLAAPATPPILPVQGSV